MRVISTVNHRLSLPSTNGLSQRPNLYAGYGHRVTDMSANFSHPQVFLFQNGKKTPTFALFIKTL